MDGPDAVLVADVDAGGDAHAGEDASVGSGGAASAAAAAAAVAGIGDGGAAAWVGNPVPGAARGSTRWWFGAAVEDREERRSRCQSQDAALIYVQRTWRGCRDLSARGTVAVPFGWVPPSKRKTSPETWVRRYRLPAFCMARYPQPR
jgi:hypothetical protein